MHACTAGLVCGFSPLTSAPFAPVQSLQEPEEVYKAKNTADVPTESLAEAKMQVRLHSSVIEPVSGFSVM